MAFEKGHNLATGRPRGSKNKASLQSIDWTEGELKEIKQGILDLVKKRNPTILGKFLDKMEANKQSITIQEENPFPEFDNMSDNELYDYIEKNR